MSERLETEKRILKNYTMEGFQNEINTFHENYSDGLINRGEFVAECLGYLYELEDTSRLKVKMDLIALGYNEDDVNDFLYPQRIRRVKEFNEGIVCMPPSDLPIVDYTVDKFIQIWSEGYKADMTIPERGALIHKSVDYLQVMMDQDVHQMWLLLRSYGYDGNTLDTLLWAPDRYAQF